MKMTDREQLKRRYLKNEKRLVPEFKKGITGDWLVQISARTVLLCEAGTNIVTAYTKSQAELVMLVDKGYIDACLSMLQEHIQGAATANTLTFDDWKDFKELKKVTKNITFGPIRLFESEAVSEVEPKVEPKKVMDVTTHLMGSLYSRRFGDYLHNGATYPVQDAIYDSNRVYPGKNPAGGVPFEEARISNALALWKCSARNEVDGLNIFYEEDGETTFQFRMEAGEQDREIKLFYPEGKVPDELGIKLDALKGALIGAINPPDGVVFGNYSEPSMGDPYLFCDTVYYKYIKENPDAEIFTKNNGEIEVEVFEGVPDSQIETPFEEVEPEVEDLSDIGMEITLTASGARNGDYDLGKLFGVTFPGAIPDRAFLKNVSITKTHLEFCNKVIQSVYRIKRREADGVTDIGSLIAGDFINVNFIGEPGTGKSFGLKIVSAILGVPLYIETFSGDSDVDKFQGTNTISKGSPQFEWTAVPTAHRDGGFCALEEVNQMRTDKTMAMSQALVDPFLLKVDGTMDVYRSPYTFYVNLFNVGTEGSKPFNEAYINRFGFTYDFVEDTKEEEKRQLKLMLGGKIEAEKEDLSITFKPHRLTETEFDWAVDLKEKVVAYLTSDFVARDEEAKTISKRQGKEFLMELQNGNDARSAAIGTFVNTIKCIDRELAEEVKTNVIDIFPFHADNY